MDIIKEIYNTEGRLDRLRYVKYMLILALILAAAKFTSSCMATFLTGDPNGALVMAITYVLAIVAGAGNIMLMIRRLHDLDKNGWFAILAIVPVIGAIFSIYLFCAKGTDGRNRYGEDPLTY